ncbi:patatin-like phospholipase family protein [Niabella sp. CC-SYL272]|uniref:patatin-like phospholipase family protein n=1 Tax=Niabella agricola TaxID=2891571 RepID=UPI001F3D727B|nr:patatin-like phospholipase family protein [Niabella agricola]MCF3110203.1 patatin-like phospholipase family protein [Niabella agricola]
MSASKKLTATDYLQSSKVQEQLAKLRAAFGANGERLVISDTLDKDGHQYVNLVQKGGGILGVALVGYTYILEQMGIRFMRLAGTSAGAINTALLAITGKKEEEKSARILEAITQLDFFDLVDGHPAARWLIKKLITQSSFFKKIKNWANGLGIFYSIWLAVTFVCLWLLPHNAPMRQLTQTLVVVLLVITLLLGVVAWYASRLLKRFRSSGYGINPGNFFYDWLKQEMKDNGVADLEDFRRKAGQQIAGLHLRQAHPDGLTGLVPDVTVIASELITENKVEFPKMCNLFRPPDRLHELHPAGLVRASMAIPLFFESYFIYGIPRNNEEIKKAWMDTFGEKEPPEEARFVDGGVLSNFPINIFYNPRVVVPRLPVFGIDLDDSNPGDAGKNTTAWTLSGYFFRIFNTVRNYYDKDFQLKNKVFSRGIGRIPLPDFNWLNFFITDKEKLELFERGAEAATRFLLNFDWEAYKQDRSFMQVALLEQKEQQA